jgi:hypothetical protein
LKTIKNHWGKMLDNIFKIFLIVCTGLILSNVLSAQHTIDARGAGMGFSNSADTRGLEYVGLNPATLALPHPFRFEFNLISVSATASNNSFDKGQYDKYFTSGNFLNESDKNDILNSIPTDGLRGDASVRANSLGIYMPYFSFSIIGLGNGYAKVPEDLPELAFRGNLEEGKSYPLGDLNGDGWGGVGILLSGAVPVIKNKNEYSPIKLLALGASIKYFWGLGYAEIIKSEGQLTNFDISSDFLFATINQNIEARYADRGRGLGIDLGAISTIDENWTVGITFLNAVGGLTWNGNPQIAAYSIKSDTFAISSSLVEEPDSIIATKDSTYQIDAFNTSLPKGFDIGVAYRTNKNFLLTAEYGQGLSNSMAGTKKARLAFGLEYTGIKVLPLRTGISFGGRFGTAFAIGFGIDLKHWFLDVAYVGYRGLTPSTSKGMTLAVTTRFRF